MSSQAASPSQTRSELLAMGVTAAVLLLADQASKAAIASTLAVGEQVSVVGDLVMLWHVRNAGAAFSLFQGGQIFFLIITVLAFAMLVYFQRAFRGRGVALYVVLGLVLGGTLGNLLDRIRLGYVTDFISVGIGSLRWPTWNVADASIVVGILALVAYLMLLDPRRGEAQA